MFKYKIKSWFKKNWHWFALIFLAAAFFIATSSFNYLTQKDDFIKWLSPDETANYTFAKYYGQVGDLRIFEKYNLYVDDIIHPRSFKSDNGELKPMSFLGMLLIYGQFVKYAGYRVLPYLTPFFGAVGIIFFYLLVKNLFGKRNAFISAFLFGTLPPYLYYSARSMFHNVLFVVLLIIGLYFAVRMVKVKARIAADKTRTATKRKQIAASLLAQAKQADWIGIVFAALGGGFIGLAIAVRSSELLWVAPLLIILWLFNVRRIGFTKLIVFISFIYIAMLPVFYWNQVLYGFPYFGGYPEMNSSLSGITATGAEILKATAIGDITASKNLFSRLVDFIFFFGFQPRESLKMFYAYFVRMFPLLFAFAVAGAALFFIRVKKLKKKYVAYLLAYLAAGAILVFYYGSWQFHDNPDPGSFTIGNSYTRYWLPIYIGAIPFASYFIMLVTRSLFPKRLFSGRRRIRNVLIKSARVIAVAAMAAVSVSFILYGSEEGLVASAQRQLASKGELDTVLALTERNATIITEYHDKLFFPERKVIYGLFNDSNLVNDYRILAGLLPVYYYNFTLPPADLEYLNTRRLGEAGLGIEPVAEVAGDFSLYKLYLTNNTK